MPKNMQFKWNDITSAVTGVYWWNLDMICQTCWSEVFARNSLNLLHFKIEWVTNKKVLFHTSFICQKCGITFLNMNEKILKVSLSYRKNIPDVFSLENVHHVPNCTMSSIHAIIKRLGVGNCIKVCYRGQIAKMHLRLNTL